MKRLFAVFLTCILVFSLSACASKTKSEISAEEIVAAYEAAGYDVSCRIYDEKLEHGFIAYIKASHPDGDYIYFSIFENEADAKSFKDEFYHPGMMGLLSVIFGDPSWHRCDVHGCIVVEYDDPDFLRPFEKLLKGK